jgi:subtilase family serine protease
MERKMGFASFFLGFLALACSSHLACAQGFDSTTHSRPLITQRIDETKRVPLAGNMRPEVNAANDRGKVADDFPMAHMMLQLKRPPEQEQALQQFIEEQQKRGSANFHQWITAQEFGERFGLAKQDLDAITGWLESHGFTVNVVYPSGMVIDFSGTAGQVREAFQTEIHSLAVKGAKHIANISDPRIPASLAPAVVGVVSLHDFRPNTMYQMRKPQALYTFTDSYGENNYAVVPADLATIYNLNPLFSAGYSGQGQTIVVIEDTNVFSTSDWNTFRSTLGLSGYTSGSFTIVHPAPSSGSNNCTAPGVIADNDAEAILDAEWASAAAPNAAIVMAACADSGATFGGLIAVQNMINASGQPPAIMSISYGQCETVNGAAANAAYNSVYQQAATEGVSVFVAAGDSGAAGCDNSAEEATHGIGVNAFASTPYNVAVGGTDFSDTYSGTNATYWNSTNTATYGSAISYIPETPWNNSCAGALLSSYEGDSVTYGSSSLCNNSSFGTELLTTVAGGGGPSGCATGTPSPSGSEIVSGTCQGWPKPSWQSVLGNPNDGVRDTPDVSLFAADGLWGHFYVFCWSDTENGGAACTGAPSGWSGAGGTSFASPIMAGIQALVNQKAGGPQGNPNPFYYQLAATEYGSSGNNSCNSSNGNSVASSCIFYDITLGDMDVNCTGTANCYLPSGKVGVLSTSDSSFNPAYGTTTGWDFASGIGSVNAANLVNNWPALGPSFSLSATPSAVTITQGLSGTSTITVTPENGFTGDVSLSVSSLPSGVTASFNPSSTASTSVLTLTVSATAAIGTFSLSVVGTSSSLTRQTPLTLNVNPTGNFTLSASPSGLSFIQGASGTSTITVSPQSGFNGSVSLSATGLPSGVTATFSPASTSGTSALTLSASSTAATGAATVTITGRCGNLSSSTSISLTVTAAPSYALSASPSSLTISQGASGTSTVTINPQGGFAGTVALSASGLPSGVTASFNPTSTTSTSVLTLTASTTANTGTLTVTVKGTSGGLSKTTTISLTVRQVPTLPSIWNDGDIGATGDAGSAGYASGVFTVKGAGAQIFGTADAFHFVYQPLSGDGTIVARLVSMQGGVGYAAAGVMIRETLTATSRNAKTAEWPLYGGIYFDERSATGGSTTEPGSLTATLPYWMKLSRSGSTFSSFVSSDGVNWVQLGTSQTISMAQNVYVGLAVNSGSTTALATAIFDNVSVNSAAAPAPVITSVSATTGSIGSQVAITGSNFGATQGSSVVLLDGSPVTINSWSATSINITIPTGATSGPLVVSVAPSMNDSNPVVFTVTSQPLPASWLDQDVGSVGLPGNANYANGVFTINAAGAEIFGTADGFHYVYQPLPGDGTVIARVVSLQGGSSYATAGVMIRNTLDSGSANAKTADWPWYGGIYFDMRTTEGGSTTEPANTSATLPYWVKVSRSGSTFSSYVSPDGVNWTQLGTSQTITMNQTVYVGLAADSGSTTASATATFDNVSITTPVAPPPNFSLSASPSSVSIAQGSSGTSTITVTPQNGFNGSVNLSATGLPSGVTASFSPNGTTSTLTLTASSTAATGTSSVTITGASGSLSNTTAVLLTVNAVPAASFTLSASPGSVTITPGSSGTSAITITPQNGFSGTVVLSATGLPNGVTASFSPNGATSTSTLTLAASSSATAGTVTVMITGTSGSLTNTTTVSLTVQGVTITTLPSVWTDGDIGSTGVPGSASYANGVFTVAGAGSEIYGTADAFNFVSQPLSGDGTIVARLVSMQGGVGYAAAGVMIRETLTATSRNAKTAEWPLYGGIYFDERSATGGSTTEPGSLTATLPYWMKLSRSGSTFSSFVSSDGVNWVQLGTSQTISMAQNVYVGLAVNSGSTTALATAIFDNVSVNSAAAPAPVITSVSATTGSIGSQVAITGSNFGATQGSSVVLLDGSPVTINSWSATSINITIPTGATSGPLVVSVAPSMNDSNPVVFTVTSQPLPASWLDQDVGSVGLPGNANYANGVFTINAAGAEIFGTADGFHYVYQPLPGDGTVIARVVSLQGGSSYATAGVMIRNTLDSGSANAKTADWPWYGGIYFDMRTTEGGSTTEPANTSATLPYWVKVSRSGSTFSSYVSPDGVNWTQLGTSQTITMNQTVYVGLAADSGSTTASATATFDNVSITTP